MDDPVATTYGERCADVYDELFSAFDPVAIETLAARLARDGVFVLEAYVPDAAFGGGPLRVTAVETDRVGLKISRHDPVAQRIQSQHMAVRDGEVRLYPVEIRYAWPSELDLMAELAGLRLRHRWSDWSRSPFTATSGKHVSVYERGEKP